MAESVFSDVWEYEDNIMPPIRPATVRKDRVNSVKSVFRNENGESRGLNIEITSRDDSWFNNVHLERRYVAYGNE